MKHNKTQKLIFTLTTLFLLTPHSQTQPNPTSPSADSFVLSCGAATPDPTPDANNRTWSPDSRFIVPSNNSSSSTPATAQSQDPSLPSTVPYMSARIFESENTYKFLVSPNRRHWIRLHFYPSPYEDSSNTTAYDPPNSFFSVTANSFVLLTNFSASITAEALTQAYIIREFSIVGSPSGDLHLTFTPSPSHPNSFAFINGIEIISMPEIFQPVPMVGLPDQLVSSEHLTMQTMFRLNVGGQYIPATEGSDLTRTWYDDSPYIYGAALGVTTKADSNVTIAYPSKESREIAPRDVYETARSMGPNVTVNANYNLTWIFEVDVNFTYLVRFHLCDYRFDKVNQMVFRVFVNNQTAAEEADVIAWSGGKGVPVYKDYATYVRSGENSLWIALHPNVEDKPEFYDSILNGLEIFKMNDTRGNLAAPNPEPSKADPKHGETTATRRSKRGRGGAIAGAVIGTLIGFGLIAGLVFALLKRKRKFDDTGHSSTGGSSSSYWLPIYGSSRTNTNTNTNTSKSAGSSRISNLGGGLCRHFMLAEIKLGTDDFSESRVIGVGGFGKVYKGSIDGKSKTVAVKRANPSSEQGEHEFLNEIDLLSKLRHRHLVSLIGACEESNEMILVYDYMENGTLREHLYKNKNDDRTQPALSWAQRLGICVGAAKGIHYLHTGAKNTIIHRDVKSTNILLDEKWVAKVSDFGLSKTGHDLDKTHVSTVVKGSFGYLDPEYFRRQKLTEKSDVYSFGVVLFEVLCGRPALSPSLPKEQVSLADWVIANHERNGLEEMIDPRIREEIGEECLKVFVETGVKCLSDQGHERPSMGEVLRNLECCLQLQNNVDGMKVADDERKGDGGGCGAYGDGTTSSLVSIAEGNEKSEEIEEHSSNSVFSQILNPRGR